MKLFTCEWNEEYSYPRGLVVVAANSVEEAYSLTSSEWGNNYSLNNFKEIEIAVVLDEPRIIYVYNLIE